MNYGGRGITVCDRWLVFDHFLADMGIKPHGCTLDRRDNNGPYSPDNCRWATKSEQANNTRTNKNLTFNGKTQTLAQWAVEIGMSWHGLNNRLARGWTVEEALTHPFRRPGVHVKNLHSDHEVAAASGRLGAERRWR